MLLPPFGRILTQLHRQCRLLPQLVKFKSINKSDFRLKCIVFIHLHSATLVFSLVTDRTIEKTNVQTNFKPKQLGRTELAKNPIKTIKSKARTTADENREIWKLMNRNEISNAPHEFYQFE